VTPTELRASIPALDDTVYLNTGASGPTPAPVVEAAEDCLERHGFEAPGAEGMYPAAIETYDRARAAVADLLGTDADRIALTHSTTDGINRVASALDWDAGDGVVRTDVEHSAGILPWANLRERAGVDVTVLDTEKGRLDPADVRAAAADAELLCFSAVTWTHGTRNPVAEIVEAAHAEDALVLVDAVQAPGQMPVDVESWGADFVAGAGHKWLLGPFGAGFLYVAPDVPVDPAHVGYRSVSDPSADPPAFYPNARRFEVGTASPAPYAGLAAAIETVQDVGLDRIERRIASLTDRFAAGVGADRLVSPPDAASGLVAFAADDPDALVERLAEEDIVVRSLPTGAVRASIHAFNTEADVDALLGHL